VKIEAIEADIYIKMQEQMQAYELRKLERDKAKQAH